MFNYLIIKKIEKIGISKNKKNTFPKYIGNCADRRTDKYTHKEKPDNPITCFEKIT